MFWDFIIMYIISLKFLFFLFIYPYCHQEDDKNALCWNKAVMQGQTRSASVLSFGLGESTKDAQVFL